MKPKSKINCSECKNGEDYYYDDDDGDDGDYDDDDDDATLQAKDLWVSFSVSSLVQKLTTLKLKNNAF